MPRGRPKLDPNRLRPCPKCSTEYSAREGPYCKPCRTVVARENYRKRNPNAAHRIVHDDPFALERLYVEAKETKIPTNEEFVWADRAAIISSLTCACCKRMDLPTGETSAGFFLCDWCAYLSEACGQCLEHGGPVVNSAKLGYPVPSSAVEQRAAMYPPLVQAEAFFDGIEED